MHDIILCGLLVVTGVGAGRRIENIALITLILVGVLINFLPTINYYLAVYPSLKPSVSSGNVFLEYAISLQFALVNITDASGSNTTVVFKMEHGVIRLTPVNETMLEYSLTGGLEISYPLNGTILYRELASRGYIPWESQLGQLLVLPGASASGVTAVNVSGIVVNLEKIPPNIISFKAMSNPSFYLKPVAHHGKQEYMSNNTSDNTQNYALYLTYWELENGGLLLNQYFYWKLKSPINNAALQILETVFNGDPVIAGMIEGNTNRISGLTLYIGLSDADIRLRNDLLGRILFDFTVTYFPVNIVLIIVGFTGLILLHRRKI